MSGIYIHIPFCVQKCNYCDFYSVADAEKHLPFFIQSVLNEIRFYSQQLPIFPKKIRTVFFGGGTPSLLSELDISAILNGIQKYFELDVNAEISLEANPGTISIEHLKGFSRAGINRLSIGAQSFVSDELELLGRIHSRDDITTTVKGARSAGFNNIGLDLIFGLPGQTLEDWQVSIHRALELEPDHISTYALTWSNATQTGRDIESGTLPKPEEDVISEMFLWTDEILTEVGYLHYEISNFAKSGFTCQHNESYWNGTPYLGLGPSAHSYLDGKRFWNVSSIDQYMEKLKVGELPRESEEILTPEQKRLESISLGLRHYTGISLSIVKDKMDELYQLETKGLGKIQKDRFILTVKGFLLADELAIRLA
ncbi:radical SAM family heme chaperone HemW [candidate division KSB1 bacterium]|nr:radical SAM family heme chaperone HemW [candidate division KSB1 bacterium]